MSKYEEPNDGGSAFPQHDLSAYGLGPKMIGFDPADEYSGRYDVNGMSMRDYFAAKALPSAVDDYGEPSMSDMSRQRRNLGNPVLPYSAKAVGTREEIIARQAYRYADAMLKAREAPDDQA